MAQSSILQHFKLIFLMSIFAINMPYFGSFTIGSVLIAFFILFRPDVLRKVPSLNLWKSLLGLFLLTGTIADLINLQFFSNREFDSQVLYTSILRLWTYFSTLIFFSYILNNFTIRTILLCWFLVFVIISFFEALFLINISFDVNPQLNIWKYALFLPVSAYLISKTKKNILLNLSIFVLLILVSYFFDSKGAIIILTSTIIIHLAVFQPKARSGVPNLIIFVVGSLPFLFAAFTLSKQSQTLQNFLNDLSYAKILEDRKEAFGGLFSFRANFIGWGLGHTMSEIDLNIALEPYSLYSTKSQYKGLVYQNYLNDKIYFHSIIWDFWARYFLAPFLAIFSGILGVLRRKTHLLKLDLLHLFFLIQLVVDLMFSTIGQFNDLFLIACLVHFFRTGINYD